MENDLKGNENCFELARGSSSRGFELPGVDCISNIIKRDFVRKYGKAFIFLRRPERWCFEFLKGESKRAL